jgi:hypothetical protein
MTIEDADSSLIVRRPCALTEADFVKDILSLLEKVNAERPLVDRLTLSRQELARHFRNHNLLLDVFEGDTKKRVINETRLAVSLHELNLAEGEVTTVIEGMRTPSYQLADDAVFRRLEAKLEEKQESFSEPAPPPDPIIGIRRRTELSDADRTVANRDWVPALIIAVIVVVAAAIFLVWRTDRNQSTPPNLQATKQAPAKPDIQPTTTTPQGPATQSTTAAASAPLEGERLHVAEDNISKLQSDGKIYNDRLEGLKHDHIYPLEDKVYDLVLKHALAQRNPTRRKTVRVEPNGANLWHLRGVRH